MPRGAVRPGARRYLSVPALNRINGEVYHEGRCSVSGCDSAWDRPKGSSSNKAGGAGTRRRSFVSSVLLGSGSSTNEKTESAPWTLVDVDIEGSRSLLDNGSTHSSTRTSRDEGPRISEGSSLMTQAYFVSRGPADPDGSAGAPIVPRSSDPTEVIQTSRSSKARQKKFHRHFKQVDIDENVLDYFSCALVGDILLQGHLYVTENFFAFYSNVFGYVTKLLIPTSEVVKISKEKTAKIIPNAIGISTEDEKHVFGSLLSRDSTYKFMVQVWKTASSASSAPSAATSPAMKGELPSDEESSASSGNEEPSSYMSTLTTGPSSEDFQKLLPGVKRKSIMLTNSSQHRNSFKLNVALTVCVILLVFLFFSAGYLLYRIAIIQSHFNNLSLISRSTDIYEDILKWQSGLHATSTHKMNEYLNANLHLIMKVRLSLEALSMLSLPGSSKSDDVEKANPEVDAKKVEHGDEKKAFEGRR